MPIGESVAWTVQGFNRTRFFLQGPRGPGGPPDEFLPAEDFLRRDGLLHYSEVNNAVGRSRGLDGQWFSTMDLVDRR